MHYSCVIFRGARNDYDFTLQKSRVVTTRAAR